MKLGSNHRRGDAGYGKPHRDLAAGPGSFRLAGVEDLAGCPSAEGTAVAHDARPGRCVVAHVLHVVAAMTWLGGLIILTVLASRVLRRGEPVALNRFVTSLWVIRPRVLAPALVVVVGLGIWMVVQSDAWGVGQTWVLLALALFAAVFLIGALFQSRAAIAADRAPRASDPGEAAQQLRRWSWGCSANPGDPFSRGTWDMVFKPGF